MPSQSDISTGVIFRTILILLGLWFLYVVRDVIILLLISIIITASLDPVIHRFQRIKLPRAAAVAVVYSLAFLLLGLLLSFLIPSLANQVEDFGRSVPTYMERFSSFASKEGSLTTEELFANVSTKIAGSLGNIFSTTIGVFSGFISIIVVISMSFYMSLREDGMRRFLVSITPAQHQMYIASLTDRIRIRLGRWMIGQVITMIFVGTLYYIVLLFLGVPFPLVLAILGGFLEIIPYIGPVLAATIATILSFFISPLTGLLVILAYFVINQIENHVLIPQIMKRAVGLHPVTVLLALLIGAKVAGVMGVILSVPVAAAISVFVKDVLHKKDM